MNWLRAPDPRANVLVDVRHIRRLQIGMLLLSSAVLSLLLLFDGSLTALPLQPLCIVASGVSLLLCAVVFVGSSRGVWSAPFAFTAVYWVFHFGLVFSYAVGAQLIEDEAYWLHQWFFRRQTHTAIVLACTGMAACVVGIYAAALIWGGGERPTDFKHDDLKLRRGLTVTGFWCVVVSLAGWLVIAAMSGGLGIIVSDYISWLAATTGKPTTWVYYGVGIGMTLLALGTPGPLKLWGFGIFAAWSLIAFPLGLRGEVLFPVTTALMVTARRRIPMSTLAMVLASLFLLVAIAVVRDLRMEGLNHASASSSMRANPLSALAEMGGSLRPVTEVVTWHDMGDEYMHGATYWAPIERAITLFVPIWKRPPGDQDERIMNVVVQERVGPIGFSVVAEAHRNFGDYGVPAVMLLLGVLLGWMESWPFTPMRGAILGIVFVELLFHIRNDFIAVPLHIALATAILLFVRFVAHYRARGEVRSLAPRGFAVSPASARPAVQGSDPNAPAAAVEAPRPAWGSRRGIAVRRQGPAGTPP